MTIIISVVLLLGLLGYFLLPFLFSGPLYQPGDLRQKETYQHLLQEANQSDQPDYFQLNN